MKGMFSNNNSSGLAIDAENRIDKQPELEKGESYLIHIIPSSGELKGGNEASLFLKICDSQYMSSLLRGSSNLQVIFENNVVKVSNRARVISKCTAKLKEIKNRSEDDYSKVQDANIVMDIIIPKSQFPGTVNVIACLFGHKLPFTSPVKYMYFAKNNSDKGEESKEFPLIDTSTIEDIFDIPQSDYDKPMNTNSDKDSYTHIIFEEHKEDIFGRSQLHTLASREGMVEILKKMIEKKGFDVFDTCCKGLTAYDYAKYHKRKGAEEYLLSKMRRPWVTTNREELDEENLDINIKVFCPDLCEAFNGKFKNGNHHVEILSRQFGYETEQRFSSTLPFKDGKFAMDLYYDIEKIINGPIDLDIKVIVEISEKERMECSYYLDEAFVYKG